MIEILAELGRRLKAFGEGDTHRAAANIARDMLSPEALAAWIALYPTLPAAMSRDVLIIMAGNLPFVGMHDLVCVLAAGHRAIVKPSSKDFENMSWVVSQLLDIKPDLPVSLISDDSPVPDAVIAMGGDDAVAAIGERHAGRPVLLRGNRSSAAVLSGSETIEELEGLADDILLYSGLGCRNISLIFVPRSYDFSELQNVIMQRGNSLSRKYSGNCRQTRAIFRMTGVPHIDCGICLMVERLDFPVEPGVLNYAYYDDLSEVKDWLSEHDSDIQCFACPPQFMADFTTRVVALGQTQHPRLTDYPDGRDTMQFLATI